MQRFNMGLVRPFFFLLLLIYSSIALGDGYCFAGVRADDLHEKVRLFTHCIENKGLTPTELASALEYRGAAYLLLGDQEKALDDFNNSIKYDPKWGTAYFYRAQIYRFRNQIDLALADLDKVLRERPADIRGPAYTIRGRIKADRGDIKGAISDFDDAVAHGRRSSDTINDAAWFFATYPVDACRNGKKAVRLALRAVKMDKENSGYHDTLAAAYAESGRFKDAVQEQSLAIKLMASQGKDTSELQAHLALYKSNVPFREQISGKK